MPCASLVAFLNNERNIKNSGVSSGDISDKLDFYMQKAVLYKVAAEKCSSTP